MSAAAALLLLLAAWLVLARAGIVSGGPLGSGFVRGATWFIFGYLVLSTLSNLTSSHAAERFGMGAITLVAAIACFIVARVPRDLSP